MKNFCTRAVFTALKTNYKTFLVMKCTILLTLLATLNVSASLYSQDTKLNLSVKDKTVKEVIKLIENQSNFRFFFSDDYLYLNKKVSLTAQNKNINEVLTDLLTEGSVTYKVLDNNVVVITPAAAQQAKISGAVTDAISGEALPGVNIVIKGTTQGATTDIDGKFTIDASATDVLVFSYVGYISKEVATGGQSKLSITLEPDVQKLDEVVVVGYGTLKKKDLTGSVSSMNAKDIAASTSANVLQVMQGKISGLDITQSSGQAGSGLNLNLRGNRSFSSDANKPLILVDGVEYGSTLDINPSDIESIDVLKDAASTAIYGTRGANGVIIITTKKGVQGVSKVTVNAYNSWNEAAFLPNIMNSSEYIQKRLETIIGDAEVTRYNSRRGVYNPTTGAVVWNQTLNPTPWTSFGYYNGVQGYLDTTNLTRPIPITNPNRLVTADSTVLALLDQGVSLDYLDMIFQQSTSQNYEIGVTGGNEKSTFSLSLGLMQDRGLLQRDLMRRYNVRLAADNKIFSNVTIGASILFTNKKYNRRPSGIFNQALKTGSIGVLKEADGSYREYPSTFTSNQPSPMLDEVSNVNSNEISDNRIFGSGFLNWEIIKGLVFRTSLGYDLNFVRNGLYSGTKSLNRLNQTASTNITNYSSWSYTWDNILTYNKTINKHGIQFMGGYSATANQKENYATTGIGQTIDATEFYDYNGFTTTTSNSYFKAQQMLSYFGRVNYKFDEKYLLQLTYRADGSSVLAKGNNWHSFPSASVGWRVNQENFLKDVSVINNLKLRASWGIAGNAVIEPYRSITSVSKNTYPYSFGGETFSAYTSGIAGTKSLDWEYTTTYDLGLDLGVFGNRISVAVDYYKSSTDKMLFDSPMPLTSVYPQVTSNIGKSENTGIEIAINTVNVKAGKFQWASDITFYANKNKITYLREGVPEVIKSSSELYRVGSPINCYYNYEKIGIYSNDDLRMEYEYVKQQQTTGDSIEKGKIPMISNQFFPGDIKINDVNGDGKYDEKDKKLFDQSPKFSFGFNNTFTFGDFGLSILTIGRFGQYINYDFLGAYKPADLIIENGPYVDAWTPQNTGAEFPRYYTQGNAKTFKSTLQYIDGSFIKIKDITLSYSLPKSILSRVKITNLKVYCTLKNYFTFTEIGNFDPEAGGSQNFPLAKQIFVGMNLEF